MRSMPSTGIPARQGMRPFDTRGGRPAGVIGNVGSRNGMDRTLMGAVVNVAIPLEERERGPRDTGRGKR